VIRAIRERLILLHMPVHPNASKEITKYISELPDFSKEICKKLRSLILKAAPGIVEDWKWGPNYNYDGMVCGYGAFKAHVVLVFFNGSAMKDMHGLFNHGTDNDYTRGIRITDINQVNEKQLAEYVKESVALNRSGYKKSKVQKDDVCPDDLYKALRKKPVALKFFESLSTGYRNEFIEHVETAKRQETRDARVAKVVAMCLEGVRLHDKYKK
jgi:hypothetical protein